MYILIGVAHLAERFVKLLRKNQSYLSITDADITCVKVAGLCHDLGIYICMYGFIYCINYACIQDMVHLVMYMMGCF